MMRLLLILALLAAPVVASAQTGQSASPRQICSNVGAALVAAEVLSRRLDALDDTMVRVNAALEAARGAGWAAAEVEQLELAVAAMSLATAMVTAVSRNASAEDAIEQLPALCPDE
ncbi:MAG: hypothetical protein AAF675_21715 [Pseudomonadota bacterium]